MTKLSRLLRDALLIGVGILAFVTTPPSVAATAGDGFLSYIWGAMMLGGAIASLIGVIRHRLSVEIFGCMFVAGAFLIWGVSALAKPDADLVTLMVSFVLFAGLAGQFYRVGMLVENRVDRS